jgi:anti-anti-sigma factor
MAELTSDCIQIERHGDIAVIIPSPQIEQMSNDQIEPISRVVGDALKSDPPTGLIFDLSRVSYVGSLFLSFLLRCHKPVKERGGEVVIAGATEKARELLHLTALDTLWALYNTRAEAVAALSCD